AGLAAGAGAGLAAAGSPPAGRGEEVFGAAACRGAGGGAGGAAAAASPAAAPEVALAGAAGFLTARFEPCGRSVF
ncbi:MAG TPA: hypothetical protein VJA16_23050, partial [Thermoanaerobaculia bacterium]